MIAATNADLEQAIRERTFRADLHDRLDEVVLRVPPLRGRRDDLPLLVDHFLALHGRRHGVRVRGLTAQARHVMARHAWPGNVRELEHAVSRAVIFAAGGWIRPVHLASVMPRPGRRRRRRWQSPGRAPPAASSGARHVSATSPASRASTASSSAVIARYQVSGETARRDLLALVRLGVLRREGRGGHCRYASTGRRRHLRPMRWYRHQRVE